MILLTIYLWLLLSDDSDFITRAGELAIIAFPRQFSIIVTVMETFRYTLQVVTSNHN